MGKVCDIRMSTKRDIMRSALAAVFPMTIPIMAGFLFLGFAYGVYMNTSGFGFVYPMLTSLFIFAGSMEFVTVGLLLAPFDPLGALMLTLMVNARHLFYGISMLEKYNIPGAKKFYLIYGMCDESFSINCTVNAPHGIDAGWFMFFVTLLNHLYWVLGSTLGGLFGSLIQFNTAGLDFAMTALFVVIFLENWLKEKSHVSSLTGLTLSLVALFFFGPSNFVIPSMALILLALACLKNPIEKAGARA